MWKSEGRWAEVAREMRLTGNDFRPTLNGLAYPDKPLVGYWLVLLAAKLTGGLTELAVRLPGAAGLVALAATVSLGRRLWSANTAITAGWLLLTSYGFLFFARLGMADMENVAAIMLAVAWYWRNRERPSLAGYSVFYRCVGAQNKGLPAIIVPIMAVLPDLAFNGQWRKHINVRHAVGLLIGAALFVAVRVLARRPEKCLSRERGARLRPLRSPGALVRLFLPSAYLSFCPGARCWCWPRVGGRCWKQVRWRGTWLALAAVLIFAFFTASGFAASYYILPILPPAALLCSVAPVDAGFRGPEAHCRRHRELGGRCGLRRVAGSAAGRADREMRYGMELPAALVWSGPVVGLLGRAHLLAPMLRKTLCSGRPPCRPFAADQTANPTTDPTAGTEAGRYTSNWRWARWLGVYPGLAPVAVSAAVILGATFAYNTRPWIFAAARGNSRPNCGHACGAAEPASLGVYNDVPADFVFYMDSASPMVNILNRDKLKSFMNSGPGPRCPSPTGVPYRLRDLSFPAERLNHPDMKDNRCPGRPTRTKTCVPSSSTRPIVVQESPTRPG